MNELMESIEKKLNQKNLSREAIPFIISGRRPWHGRLMSASTGYNLYTDLKLRLACLGAAPRSSP